MGEKEHKKGILEIISEIEKNECIRISVFTKTEILIHGYEPEKWKRISSFLSRPELLFLIVSDEKAELAAEIRRKLLKRSPSIRLPTCDAIHLATAIYENAFRLHTTDKHHLLKLQGKLPGFQIELTRPMGLQNKLF